MMGYTVSAVQISANRRTAFLLAQALRRCLRVANFVELRKGEVHRILFPRTPVNSRIAPARSENRRAAVFGVRLHRIEGKQNPRPGHNGELHTHSSAGGGHEDVARTLPDKRSASEASVLTNRATRVAELRLIPPTRHDHAH